MLDIDWLITFLLAVIMTRLFLCPTKQQVEEIVKKNIYEHIIKDHKRSTHEGQH